MQWRPLRLARAWWAAGLVIGSTVLAAPAAVAQSKPESAPAFEPTAQPAGVESRTVDVLAARREGVLEVAVRGQGQSLVKMTLQNKSGSRLNVVVPPGLVAAAQAGQPGGPGGGLQSMGLGAVDNQPGGFGRFQAMESVAGLQSIPVAGSRAAAGVAVPAGETIEFTMPAVCLNFGLATPTPRDSFELMDVTDYTPDPRIRKALRSLASYGTSQGVAQAAMWRVCNDLPFETMAAQGAKIMNKHEIALASRFVEAVDSTTSSELVDPNYLVEGRVFVQIAGGKTAADAARRLAGQLEGLRLFGLPVRVADAAETPIATAPALLLRATLDDSQPGEVRGRIVASSCKQGDQWVPLGKAAFTREGSMEALDGPALAKALERATATAFVSVKTAKRSVGETTLRVENRLPFTIAGFTVKTGESAGSPSVPFDGVGIGPVRSSLVQIQAAAANIESIRFNGL